MPSSYSHASAAAFFVFLLTFAPYAHAEATAITVNNPFTDAIQLWSGVLSSIDALALQLAAALQPAHALVTGSSQKPQPSQYPAPRVLAAAAALATGTIPRTETSSGSQSVNATAAPQAQSRSPSSVTTIDRQSAIVASASTFVTQNQFNAGLSALAASLRQLVSESASNPVVSGPGAPLSAEAFAPSQQIDNLSNVTISNATIDGVSGLTASDIPALDYLSLSGGAVAGNLLINGNATSSNFFASSTSATNLSTQTFTANGTSSLAAITLSSINCSAYGNGGKLTTDGFGNVICAADQSGGAGSTVAGSNGQVQFNAFGSFGAASALTFATSTGILTAPTVSSTNSSTTNATSTTLFSALANFTTAVATNFSTTNATTASLGINGQTFTNLLGTGLGNTSGALNVSLSPFTTSNLAEGSNLYFTNNRVAAVVAGTTTDALAEGVNNKYFTNARAQAAIAVSGAPLTYSGGVLGINQANASTNGFLASSDWANFNGKLASSSLSAGTGISYNSSTGVIANTGVTSVAAAGGSTGLTFTGSPITTTGTFTLGGLLGIGYGGTGTSTAPSYGQLLVGNGSGSYTLAATSTLGISSLSSFSASAPLSYNSGTGGFSISQANASTNGFLASSDWTNFNGKLASSSLVTSALLAGLVSDHTGSGSLVFATSPTFAGTPVFSGGVINDSVNSTTTIPSGTPYAWTVATSTSASPLIEVDTNGNNGSVSIGAASSSGSSVVLGATGEPANLVFAASSTIEGAGTGQLIAIGANSDVVDFGVNVGIGTSTPGSIFSVNGVANLAPATSTFYSSGGINLTSGCFSIAGTCITGGGGPTYTFSYPLVNAANTISEAWGTTTANVWSQLQTFTSGFISNASSTVNGAVTITGKTTLGNASTTVFSVSGNSYLATAQANSLLLGNVVSCGGGEALQTDGSGNVSCGTIAIGGSSVGGGWLASGGSVNGTITESTSTYLVAVGATSTPYAKLSILSGSAATTTLALVPATAQTADILDIYNTSGSLGSVFTAAGSLGIGTTTPGSILSINGVGNFVANATSTLYQGLNITFGCFSINGTCVGGASVSAANVWSQLQTFTSGFISNASSTINGNATITGQTTLGNASSTNLTASGEGFFGTASTTNLYISGIANGSVQCLQINAVGQVTGTGSGCGGSGSTPGGSNTQVQYNSSGAFAGSSNLVFNGTDVGIGTSTPWGELAISAQSGSTYPGNLLFDIASSTASATTTLFSIDNKGDFLSTLAASSTFTVGANGLTNPAFQIFASTTNAVTGLALTSNVAGGSVGLAVTSSGTNEGLTISGKGQSNIKIDYLTKGGFIVQSNGSQRLSVTDNISGNSIPTLSFSPVVATGRTAGTEAPFVTIFGSILANNAQIHANSQIPIQREFIINPVQESFATYSSSNNITDVATLGIASPPVIGTNGTATNAYSLLIGSSTASTMLNASTTNSYGLAVWTTGGAQNTYSAIFNGGNVGIGTTTPYARLGVWGPDTASTSAFAVSNSASTTEFSVYDTGNAVLAGSLTQSSDQRLKTNIQSLDASSSLSLIDQLNPVTFNWIDPNKSSIPQLGFIAQQVLPIFPNLVSTTSPTALTPGGTLSLNYIDLISPIVSAIQALSADITSIQNTIAGFATVFHTQELCVGSTCVTPAQFQAMVASYDASQSSAQGSDDEASVNTSATIDTPPIIQINGDNPAIIQAGDIYNDLGASIRGPQADLNLGITTYVNGTGVSLVQIDTSAAATDTIDYVVTDQNGFTSTSTRTVIIEASPSIAPADDASTTITTTADSTSSADVSTITTTALSGSYSTASTTEGSATTNP